MQLGETTLRRQVEKVKAPQTNAQKPCGIMLDHGRAIQSTPIAQNFEEKKAKMVIRNTGCIIGKYLTGGYG